MERILASTTPIKAINPIDGADKIEVARVKGWDVVVGKGSHKVGDMVAYFEIDSALPVEDPHFSQFEKRGVKTLPDGTKVHVLKTIKLRGQISQGLVMSLEELNLPAATPEDTDLTEVLGVVKWEPPIPDNSRAKGSFLTQYADKTDSERVQNIKDQVWDQIQSMIWTPTEKLDGTSITVVCEDDWTIRVCSRNQEVGEDSLHYRAAVMTGLVDYMVPGYTVQGEVVGPGIQGNPLKLEEPTIFIFDVWRDRKVVPFLQWPTWAKEWTVPTYTDLSLPPTIEEAVAQVNGLKSRVNPNVQAEGVVWHSIEGIALPKLGRTTFKVINNRYLLES